ncbi:DUF1516 family protein [Brevibacillus fulvus]|uniref:Small-conductance mechanosensitive channel n=1 Tax=Brevibacillus fulvus TaxID=1125967 RepID=A0A938Y0C0_9BACL|nr:DUF1516 family protein [Brevibacillus fulvus]MBM7588805.1 small-conductance mechanosensitive channel [Brevibacillus fulvus]
MGQGLLHAHVGAWEAAFVLYIIAYILVRLRQNRIAKILHMILRLLFVIIVVSGLWMLFAYMAGEVRYYIKGILGLVTIGLIEMTMGRATKGKANLSFFILSLVLFVLVILIGYQVI